MRKRPTLLTCSLTIKPGLPSNNSVTLLVEGGAVFVAQSANQTAHRLRAPGRVLRRLDPLTGRVQGARDHGAGRHDGEHRQEGELAVRVD